MVSALYVIINGYQAMAGTQPAQSGLSRNMFRHHKFMELVRQTVIEI